MFQEVAEVIAPILEEKCFIDCWGGFSRVISYKDPKTKQICTYPISCYKLNECKPGQPYIEMLPSDKYKSVAWLEGKGTARKISRPTKFSRMPKGKGKWFELDLRLKLWYNIKSLGYENCSIADKILGELISCLCVTGAGGDFAQIAIDVSGFSINDVTETFGAYSYKDIATAFGLYPYEFLTVDLKVRFMLVQGCGLLAPFVCKEPIEC